MDTMYIVGKKIAHYRKQNNISQQAFAELCGISIRYLSQIENKGANLSYSIITQLCTIMNQTPKQLLADPLSYYY